MAAEKVYLLGEAFFMKADEIGATPQEMMDAVECIEKAIMVGMIDQVIGGEITKMLEEKAMSELIKEAEEVLGHEGQ